MTTAIFSETSAAAAVNRSIEKRRHAQAVKRATSAPLHFRREARADYRAALTGETYGPGWLAREVDNLLGGNLGAGAMHTARDLVADHHNRGTRFNLPAALCHMIAVECFQCSPRMARAAWLTLPRADRDALTADVIAAIDQVLYFEHLANL